MEPGLRKRRAIRGNQRIALDAPRAAGQVQPPYLETPYRAATVRERSAAAVYFHFAEDGSLGRRRDVHLQPHISASCRFPQFDLVHRSVIGRCGGTGDGYRQAVVAGKRLQNLPVGCIVGHVEFAPSGAPDPNQLYLVESTDSSEIDVDPFDRRACALPRAGEIIRPARFHAAALIEKRHLADQPPRSAGSIQRHAIEAAVRRRSQRNGRLEFARRTVRAGRTAQFLPGLPIVRAGDHRAPACGQAGGLSHLHARVDIHAIDFQRVLAARQFNLHPSARALQTHSRQPVVIQQPFALVLGKFALLARRDCHPARRLGVLDAVGN